jgi:acyl-CoA reductase-like NAD-dependent aldehyde dehydrogenase
LTAPPKDYGVYSGGRWCPALSGAGDAAHNPATGEVVATVARGGAADVDRAVAGARAAWPAWARASAFDRAEVLAALAAAVQAEREPLARILSLDQGKPLVAEAYDEVDELVVYLAMAAEDAKRAGGVLPPSTSATRRVLVQRVPLGVIGVISPWNWPYTMGAELVAPALAAGNTVVWVPAPTTSACSAALVEVLSGALAACGAPEGILSLVPGPGAEVGRAVTGHPDVAGIGFVGSVATGADVAVRSAGKAQILELGGNGPFVVLDDADLDAAVAAGARVVTGGGRAAGYPTDLFFLPTLIDGVDAGTALATEETFGPVVPVIEIDSEHQALELCNASPFGLTASVWTADLARGLRFAEAAHTGWVNINGSTNLWESHLPFGGRAGTASGTGRVGGAFPLERFTEPKTITFPLGPT